MTTIAQLFDRVAKTSGDEIHEFETLLAKFGAHAETDLHDLAAWLVGKGAAPVSAPAVAPFLQVDAPTNVLTNTPLSAAAESAAIQAATDSTLAPAA